VPAFGALVDEFLRGYWARNPVHTSFVGIHDHDGELGDFSRDGFAERDAYAREWERRFAAVPDETLTASQRIDREVVLAELRGALALQPFEAFTRHAPLYVQAITLGAQTLLLRDFAPLEDRLARIAERLSRAPLVLEHARRNLQPERTAPVHVVVAGEQAAAAATFVRAYLPSLAQEGLVKRDLLLAGQDAAAALDRYAAWLRDEFMRSARGSFAIGRDALEALLGRQHLLAHDAASIVRLGQEAYEETAAALDAVAHELGAASWQAAVEELKRDHPRSEELLETYRAEVDRARQAVLAAGLVTTTPGDELDVLETPAFQRPTVPYALYFPPAPFEPARRGTFYVTLPDPQNPERERELRLQGHMRKGIPVVVAHEAYPGHHLQLERAAEHPSLARRTFWSPFLIEGWGLYAEELMTETGYLADPATRLLRLKGLLWRTARVILDVGLATGEMNFEQAVNFLVEGPRLERPNAIAEVRRYTLTPTQPMSYLVGRMEILRLRERARTQGMALRDFHDRLLQLGSIPLALAARELGLS
jgi:uncharacterized protein (DUF885 family)